MRRGAVGIGDVMRAAAAIAPDDPARWPAIAAALGFEMRGLAEPPSAAIAPPERPRRSGAQPRQIAIEGMGARREASLPVLAPLMPAADQRTLPPFLLSIEKLPQEQAALSAAAIPTLLPPSTTPSLLRAATVVAHERGPLDVDAVVDAVARRRPLARVPRRRVFGVARDVVVLQDLGAGMDAFIEDVEPLIAALHDVVGRDALRVDGFLGRPAEALEALGLHRGTVVMVLTDLGMTRLAGPDETGMQRWIELADATARAAARATLLVPWPPERWPHAVAARLAVVTWDRTASVAQVLRAVRERV